MEWLVSELRESAEKRHVFQLSEVWNRYCELAQQANVEIPASFRSRRATFKEKLKVYPLLLTIISRQRRMSLFAYVSTALRPHNIEV